MTRDLPKVRHVLFIVVAAALVAYLSAGKFPDPLAYGPLGPIFLIFVIYPVAESGGWLMHTASFFLLYIAVCLFLSTALLKKHRWAWDASAATFIVLVLGNAWYFSSAWELGNRWQGSTYLWLVFGLNVLVAAVAALFLYRSRLRPHRPNLLLGAHAANLFWLSWIAFPWLGELI